MVKSKQKHFSPFNMYKLFTKNKELRVANHSESFNPAFIAQLFDSLPVGIAIMDLQGNLLYLNERLQASFPQNVLGQKCWTIFKNTSKPCTDCLLQQKDHQTTENKLSMIHPLSPENTLEIKQLKTMYQGKEVIVEIFNESTPASKGETELQKLCMEIEESIKTHTVGVLEMLLLLKEKIAESNSNNEFFTSLHDKDYYLFENANAGIWISDLQNKIIYVNKKISEMLGYKNEEMLNMPMLRFMSFQDQAVAKTYKQIYQNKQMQLDCKWCRKNGTEMWTTLSTSPVLDSTGNQIGVLGILIDITTRKQKEDELRITKENAESINHTKNSFFAKTCHEIRTPMNGIIGMTDLLLTTSLSDEQKEYVSVVKNSSDALLNIVNDILDFSKIEAGKLELENIRFDLRNTIEKVTESFALQACWKNIELASYIYPNVPLSLIGDPGRLRQVLVNLIGNAIKFTEKGKVIVLVERDSTLDQQVTLRFYIVDTGIGIAEEKIPRLFHDFNQITDSQNKKYDHSSGLGLSISKRLIEMMGGNINIQSKVKEGSTFSFTVTFGLQENMEKISNNTAFKQLYGLSTLIVSDNETSCLILKMILNDFAMEIQTAFSGEQGLKILQKQTISFKRLDFIILDAQISDMDRFTFLETIQNDPVLNRIPVIMFSYVNSRVDTNRCKDLGVAGHLLKPIKQSELGKVMLRIISKDHPQTKNHELVTRHTIDEESLNSSMQIIAPENTDHPRILLVEDNYINQKLVSILLQKKGLEVTAVENSRKAIELLYDNSYDLILMDIQMPEMDGYEATKFIRQLETEHKIKTKNNHVPIIAMTACAMKGDREKCLAAGMDDYISKPIKIEFFNQLIKQWLYTETTPHDTSTPSIELTNLLDIINNDQEIYKELTAYFLQEYPQALSKMEKHLRQKNNKQLEQTAHKLKGSLSNFGARNACQLAEELERMGHDNQIDQSAFESLKKLENELEKIKNIFQATTI